MKAMESFLVFYYILDYCYVLCQEDDLGGVLGAISPELWEDGKPMDKAVFEDWQKISVPQTINKENIIKKTYDFMNYYEKTFGFEFYKTKQALLTLNSQNLIENAIKKAQKMYLKHNYND